MAAPVAAVVRVPAARVVAVVRAVAVEAPVAATIAKVDQVALADPVASVVARVRAGVVLVVVRVGRAVVREQVVLVEQGELVVPGDLDRAVMALSVAKRATSAVLVRLVTVDHRVTASGVRVRGVTARAVPAATLGPM